MERRLKIALFFMLFSVLAACGGDDEVPVTAAEDVMTTDTGADAGADSEPPDTTAEEDTAPACPSGDPCDDGNPCTVDDRCANDQVTCVGDPNPCDDGLPCTIDSCDEQTGCGHAIEDLACVSGTPATCLGVGDAVPGSPCQVCGPNGGLVNLADSTVCEDNDACTPSSSCLEGQCEPDDVIVCEPDDNPCTSDDCDIVNGCLYPPTSDPCDDGDPCTTDDVCAGGICAPGEPLGCDDNEPCTTDSCIEGVGCFYEQTGVCVDSDPCTDDVCENGNCSNTPFDGPCEDGDPCTSGEVCTAGVCDGGGPTDCDDTNVCTQDVCEEGVGCVHYYSDGATCSDGFSCTLADTCVVGQCLGTKVGCTECVEPDTDLALKIIELTIPSDGNAGSGLDVDENPTTCAPAGNCSGGVDNALALLAELLNPGLSDTITAGTVQYVADFSQLDPNGQPFPFSVLETDLTEADEAAGCDFQAEECDYEASQFSYGPDCIAYFGLPDAVWTNGSFTAGGIGAVMTIALRLSGGVFIPITLVNARVKGQLTLDPAMGNVLGATGVFAGATPKQQLIETIDSIDFEDLPVDKETALSLLNALIVNDIDLDGNGEPDGASIAIRFVGIPANLKQPPAM